MSAGWLYNHKWPPKRKCRVCGKRHFLVRGGTMSNGADVWYMVCEANRAQVIGFALTSDGWEG